MEKVGSFAWSFREQTVKFRNETSGRQLAAQNELREMKDSVGHRQEDGPCRCGVEQGMRRASLSSRQAWLRADWDPWLEDWKSLADPQ